MSEGIQEKKDRLQQTNPIENEPIDIPSFNPTSTESSALSSSTPPTKWLGATLVEAYDRRKQKNFSIAPTKVIQEYVRFLVRFFYCSDLRIRFAVWNGPFSFTRHLRKRP